MKRFLRAIQVLFPFIPPTKYAVYNFGTRRFGHPMDAEFRLLRRARPVGLVLDIGANWGQSIAALKHTARPAKIISFEPNKALAQRLARLYTGDPTVQIEDCGLSDEAGTFDLFIPRYRNYLFDGLASLRHDEAANWLNSERMAWFDASRLIVEKQEVVLRALDTFDLVPDVVKIDVQGSEHSVVLGGLKTFQRSRPIAIIEEPSDALVQLLASLGMAAYHFDGERLLDNWRGQKNVVFLTDERRRALGL